MTDNLEKLIGRCDDVSSAFMNHLSSGGYPAALTLLENIGEEIDTSALYATLALGINYFLDTGNMIFGHQGNMTVEVESLKGTKTYAMLASIAKYCMSKSEKCTSTQAEGPTPTPEPGDDKSIPVFIQKNLENKYRDSKPDYIILKQDKNLSGDKKY